MTVGQIAAGIGVILAVAVPFLLLGMAIGYSISAKAALAVVQVVLFPLAFAGGLLLPPQAFPTWLDSFSQALTGEPAYALALPVLAGWAVLFAALTVWAYRRDEGRRSR